MAQHDVEMIVLKQVASYLAMPIFLVDLEGNLLYFNEPAEAILGRRYDETGELPAEEWATASSPVDDDGVPIPPDDLPLTKAVREHRPAHGKMHVTGLDGVHRHIEVTVFPLEGQSGRRLGSIAIFWEAS